MAKEPNSSNHITDIKSPDKVKPTASSRPIVVSDRSMLAADPMMAPAVKDEAANPEMAGEPTSAPTVSRQAKQIIPVHADVAPETAKETAVAVETEASQPEEEASAPAIVAEEPAIDKEAPAAEVAEAPETSKEVDTEDPKPKVKAKEVAEDEASPPVEPELAEEETPPTKEKEPAVEESPMPAEPELRDTEAQNAAAENAETEAETARQQELEGLIGSGKYNVPVNAVQRKRSRMFLIGMAVLAILLTVAIIDLLLDMHFLVWPSHVPHTHLFTTG